MPSLSHDHYFDLSSALHVPDSHTWPTSSLHDHPTATGEADAIPIIDISGPNAASLIAACRSCGVFYATGHGVPARLLHDVELQVRRLFSLPLHRKLLAAPCSGSVSGYGRPPLSSFFPKLMWSEGFTLSGDPLPVASKLWPHDYSRFCELIEEYYKEMKKLAERLIKLMLLSLGLDEDEMDRVGPVKELLRATDVLQLNSYPACPDPERAMGMAAHTDSALLTILHQSDGTDGLQVLRDGEGSGPAHWAGVPPLPGALVIIVGDLFQILSNGRFQSSRHRAAVSRADHRVSIAYFIGPPEDVKIGPVGSLVDQGRGPEYRPVTWPEYLGIRAHLFDSALASVTLCGMTEDAEKND
ncbi:Gibberellin 3-beta-dioxygenase 1 [Apostasia shenzhenica]|uniref:Gibberellin 3-beta-dioxygenase 1 n=1 Tax=Apostasia shenzhenica TaxID=1088818 RepID=A0A2I0B9R4_9ASPA|nr:Gibberellin 3-beta-dioxygenase 1 [Apostasia shenzhenica]